MQEMLLIFFIFIVKIKKEKDANSDKIYFKKRMHFHCATIKVKITFEWSIEKNSPQDIESQTINCPSMHVILLGLFDIFYYVSRLTRTISFLAGLPLLNRNMVPVQSEVKFTVNCVTFLQTFPQLLFIHTKLKKLLWWVQWHHWINIITFLWIFFFFLNW